MSYTVRSTQGRHLRKIRRLIVPALFLCLTLVLTGIAGLASADPTREGLGGAQQVNHPRSFVAAKRQLAHLEKKRRTPQARKQRRRSRRAFAGLSDSSAIELGTDSFPAALASPVSHGLGLSQGEHVDSYLGDFAARIEEPGSQPDTILESTAPLRAVNESGNKAPVKLDLQDAGEHFESRNPSVEVSYSKDPDQGVTLKGAGISVSLTGTPVNAQGHEEANRLVVPDAATDTDLWLVPRPAGFEVMAVLRSADSPERFTLDVGMPPGAELTRAPDGGAVVRKAGTQLAAITAPVSEDMDGMQVPTSMSIEGTTLVIEIHHTGSDLHYPLLLDPEVIDETSPIRRTENWDWYGRTGENEEDDSYAPEGWSTATNHSGAFDAAFLNLPSRWGEGLYTFTHVGATVNNGDYSDWRLNPPGTTTKIYRTELEVSTNGYNGCYVVGISDGQQTTGCGSMSHAYFVRCAVESCDPTKGGADNYAFYRISSNTTEKREEANKLIGDIGYASVRYTDNEVPSFSGMNSGGTSGWAKSFSGTVSGTVQDAGVGLRYNELQLSTAGIYGGNYSGCSEPNCWHPEEGWLGCEGIAQEPCAASLGTGYSLNSTEIPDDGKNKVTVVAEDGIEQVGSYSWGNVWLDRAGPKLAMSGALWSKSDQPNEENVPTTTPIQLTIGSSFELKIEATDGATAGGEATERSGVKSVEIKVDNETVLAADSVSCPGGSCPDTRTWTWKTSEFPSGEREVKIIAKDQIGNETVRIMHVKNAISGKLNSPLSGTKTSRWAQLQATAEAASYSTVKFQAKKAGGTWIDIPLAALSDSSGKALSSIDVPLTASVSPTINWEVAKTFTPPLTGETQVQVRAMFSGSSGSGSSNVNRVTFEPKGIGTDDARSGIGPGEVNLATGNFNVGATDASVASWGTGISVARAFNSRNPGVNPTGPFGPGWTLSVPVDGASEYASLQTTIDAYGTEVAELKTTGGETIYFYLEGGQYKPEPGYETMILTAGTNEFTLKDDEANTIVFKKEAGTTGNVYVPTSVQQQVSANTSSVQYEVVGGVPRVKSILAPVPSGVTCTAPSYSSAGCRSLKLIYATSTTATGTGEAEWGNYNNRIEKVEFTAYDPATSAMKTDVVSQYLYDNTGRLRAQWDPRISPALKTKYSYDAGGRLSTITPPGENTWTFAYAELSGDGDGGRLKSVSRSTPQGTATTTVVYQVPLSGSGAPYSMTPTDVAVWDQKEVPVGATAIFPPDTVPTEPPASYTRATVHYLGFSGREVNTAATGAGISTSEYDIYGNAVRELSPANRQRAIEAGAESAAVAQKLDTEHIFVNKGTEMTEELGPEHQIKLANGESVKARARTTITYDEGAPAEKDPHLPTTTTIQAKVTGGSSSADAKVIKTEYDWTLLQPTKTIKDYGGLNITENNTYTSIGLVEGTYKPKYPKPAEGVGTPDRKTIYYSAGANEWAPECGNKAWFANLPCKIERAAWYGEVPRTIFEYNRLNQATKQTEEVTDRVRTTTTTYDSAGRQITSRVASSTDSDNLALAYGFEETAGTTATDKSGNNNTGTLENLTRVTYGRYGRALEFDSSTDKITVPDSASLVPNGAITMEAWVRPDVGATYQPIFSKPGGTGCASPSYFLKASGSTTPQPEVAGCATYFAASSSYKLPVGMWSHLAATIDSSKNAKIYVNGEVIAAGTVASSPGASVGSLVIGSGFDGLIDEARVYTRALSKSEIHSDMTMAVDSSATPPSVPVKSGLIAAYGFEELENAGTKIVDSSSLANNGTLSGSRTQGGRIGAAIQGEATVSHTTALSISKGATFETWIYPTSMSEMILMELGSQFKLGTFATGGIYSFLGEGLVMTETNYLTLNQPHHIAVTFDGSTLKLYVDGVQRATGFATKVVDAKTLKMKAPSGGRMDEVRIYSRALTQTEVKEDSTTPVVLQQSAQSNGTKLPTVTTGYSSTTGRPTTLSTTEGGVTKTLTTGYDSIGRVVSYEDADGISSTTKYDIDGRVTEVNDGKGTQTYGYDTNTGQQTLLVDSLAGTFTAGYDTVGQLTSQVYPNGMKAATTYDETGTPTLLKYTKSGCGTCVWYEQSVSESIRGQWLTNDTTVANHSYTYDGVGRLTMAKETPAGKGCTTREYTYDADSNRLSKTTRAPGEGGACVTSGAGTTQSSTYDGADRITGTGFQYDAWGRLLEIPTSHSGGGALAMTYYVNDMTRTSTQDGKTVGWLLDPTQTRQRATITSESKQTIYHYSDGSDSPSWTANFTGETLTGWQRGVGAISGGLGALVNYNGSTTTTTLQMTNLHGDVVGTATTSSEAEKPTELFEADEFGNPTAAGNHEYGWLGGKKRRTTLASGLIQMGVRSYVPSMGRFTSVDPVYGGSANAYDYVGQDPINSFDYDGTFCIAATWGLCWKEKANEKRKNVYRDAFLREAVEKSTNAFKALTKRCISGSTVAGLITLGESLVKNWKFVQAATDPSVARVARRQAKKELVKGLKAGIKAAKAPGPIGFVAGCILG